MKRRTLDLLFSAGGIALAGLLLVLGLVMTSNADFAQGYVRDQLTQQHITFTPVDGLSEEEAQSDCLVRNAGLALTSGAQAECYANEYIGLHLQATADGQTFADLGPVQSALRDDVAAAEDANSPTLEGLRSDLDEITAQRDTLFRGETLRGLLLTSFGFSVFGDKGEQVASVAYGAAALLALLSLAGFAHAFRTPEDEAFALPAHTNGHAADKELVGV